MVDVQIKKISISIIFKKFKIFLINYKQIICKAFGYKSGKFLTVNDNYFLNSGIISKLKCPKNFTNLDQCEFITKLEENFLTSQYIIPIECSRKESAYKNCI